MDNAIGKTILVGLTIVSNVGAVEQRQLVGTITECSPDSGILIASDTPSTEDVRLPYCPVALVAAPPGTYNLAGSNREVKDPDYITSWTFQEDKSGVWHARPESSTSPSQ